MKFEKQVDELSGALSAIYTPYDDRGEVNFEMLSKIASYQLNQGLQGFFLTGSTGESLLLSSEERIAVIRHVCQEFGERAVIIAHVGHPSTDVATQLARQAADSGADWIASVAPIYYGTTFAGAMRHYGQIASATELPFMVYSLGGVIEPKRDAAFFELPNVCGLKYTGANFYSVQQLLRLVDRPVAVMNGFDEQLVASLSFGFRGGIGSTYNFAPQFYANIFRHYRDGNIEEASRLQAEINKVTFLMTQYENRSFGKAIMKYIGFDCGSFRSPYAPLEEAECIEFFSRLDELNVLRRDQGVDAEQMD